MEAPNRNLLWAKVFVQELARSGLRAACIAPGSRSTPLAIALADQPEITVYSLIDERSCAFFALGLALSSEQPVAILCSSGTATANFYPAIIEAHYSGVPLIVLTADRSHELRDSGANQTVDQIKMYGDHVLWSVDVALPEAQPPAVLIRSLRTLANRAYATANGMMGATVKGAVHLNFPFRKPLEPTYVESDLHEIPDERADNPFTTISRSEFSPTLSQVRLVADAIREARRGIIVCGPRHVGDSFHHAIADLAEVSGFPVLADPLSGVRFHPKIKRVIGGYDTFLKAAAWESPDVVLHFGAAPTSQTLDDYLNQITLSARIAISADGQWRDPNHRISHFIWAEPYALAERVAQQLSHATTRAIDEAWIEQFTRAEAAAWEVIDDELTNNTYFDGAVLADVVDLLPDHAMLFVASSLPVRHLDQFGKPNTKALRVFANRGASGIDGTISSALGAGAARPNLPLTLVTGDLAFYHDMNGLLAIKRLGIKATIVVINNDGGGIFHRLPVAKFDPPFTDLFVTPHGLTFEHAAQMYGLDYVQAGDISSFRNAFAASLASQNSTIIEVPTNAEHDLARRNQIVSRVVERLKTTVANNVL